MDEHFTPLVDGDAACCLNCGALRSQHLGWGWCPGSFDCPALRVWNDVLISFHFNLGQFFGTSEDQACGNALHVVRSSVSAFHQRIEIAPPEEKRKKNNHS